MFKTRERTDGQEQRYMASVILEALKVIKFSMFWHVFVCFAMCRDKRGKRNERLFSTLIYNIKKVFDIRIFNISVNCTVINNLYDITY